MICNLCRVFRCHVFLEESNMQCPDQQCYNAFRKYGSLNADLLRNEADDKPPQWLHTKERHSIKADNTATHGGDDCCLDQGIADRNLAHHSKCSYYCTDQCSPVPWAIGEKHQSYA